MTNMLLVATILFVLIGADNCRAAQRHPYSRRILACARGAPSRRPRPAIGPTRRAAVGCRRRFRFSGNPVRANAGARAFVANADDDDVVAAAAGGRAVQLRGPSKTGRIERSALSSRVRHSRAESSCARGAPTQRRRSAEPPAGAAWAAVGCRPQFVLAE